MLCYAVTYLIQCLVFLNLVWRYVDTVKIIYKECNAHYVKYYISSPFIFRFPVPPAPSSFSYHLFSFCKCSPVFSPYPSLP
ncbi:hypothetical protein XELAEV_18025740mg [Xenopus laevis]|uniref:Uncharacterized protein n=1 Tax=Xenopus laevis TaxID=8355 RepID=A0A974D192_XENLA|nr:hypothetical protein XELAEV_18025740mg [Xenopus laevis]